MQGQAHVIEPARGGLVVINPAATVAPAEALEFCERPSPDTSAAPLAGGASLLERLAKTLEAQGIAYCQWKGRWSADRWSRGLGDVDLLVDHAAITAFRRVAGELGFKLALERGERQIPGVESYFGRDPGIPRLLHLHVHYRLIIGDHWGTTYRIPVEQSLLETTVAGGVFRIPDPTYQLLIFVLRTLLRRRGRLRLYRARPRSHIRIQLEDLEAFSDRGALATILRGHLPSVDLAFFDRCVNSLRGETGSLEGAVLPHLLHLRLRAYARRPPFLAVLKATIEKILPPEVSSAVVDGRMRLASGGIVLALIGGDGAGKSTCSRELGRWLSTDFPAMRAHLGRPPRSLFTLAVGGALRAEGMLDRLMGRGTHGASHVEVLRNLCTARDRYRLYEKVRRFTAAGGIAICERYPVPESRFHAGPSIPELLTDNATRFAKLLRTTEASYYERILPPDALFVLRLDPELAVLRKPEEPAEYVRTRGRMIWETDWSKTRAQVVDTSRPLPEVFGDLKTLVWSAI